MSLPPIRSWLYAPGNNEKLLERVFTAGADAVILDLEDSVPVSEKARAREMVAATIASRPAGEGPVLFVRINPFDTGLAEADIRAVVKVGIRGLRIPKVEDPGTVDRLNATITECEARAGIPVSSIKVVVGIESAIGVHRALEIAKASPRIHALNLGIADLTRDLSISLDSSDGIEVAHYKSSIVLASRLAGIARPVDSVTTQLDDLERLEREARAGRALGFFGKSAIHPRQVAVINAAYTPTDPEIAYAREVVDAAAAAEARGSGAIKLANGDFVDVPIVVRARHTLELARQLGVGGAE